MLYRTLFLLIILTVGCSSNESEQASAGVDTEASKAVATKMVNRNYDLESPDFSIQIQGAPAGKGYLMSFYRETRFVADSAQVNSQGKVTFKREEPYEPGLYYVFFSDQSAVQFLIDADQTFSLATSVNNIVQSMQVEGSLENELLYKNLKFEAEYSPRFSAVGSQLRSISEADPQYASLKAQQDEMIQERKDHLQELFDEYPNSFFTAFKRSGQNPDIKDFRKPDGSVDAIKQIVQYRSEFWDNVNFNDERLLRTPVIFNKLNRYITEITDQKPDSIIASVSKLMNRVPVGSDYYEFFSNWIAVKYTPGETPIMDAEAIYVHMVQNYFTRNKAFWMDSLEVYRLQMRASEMANSLVGQKGPNVKAKNPGGVMKAIYDSKAPYVVVFMYNPTCDHCIEETPKLVDFYNRNKAKGVDVYAIALDTDDKTWKDFIASNNMGFTNVFDPTNQSIYKTYYVDNTPEIYVLNEDRVIIGKNLKVSQLDQLIALDQQRNG